MTWEDIFKNKGVAVTAGKTKTVNRPIVEDDDNDCINRFERICGNYLRRFDSVVKTKIENLVDKWNSDYKTMARFGPKYQNKIMRNTIDKVEMSDDDGSYTIFSRDSLKIAFNYSSTYKQYLELIKTRGVPDELICIVVKHFVDAWNEATLIEKEFEYEGKKVAISVGLSTGHTNTQSTKLRLVFMHDGSFYGLISFFVGFDRSHYSWEAYDNQEEHAYELWSRIAYGEMEKFVRLLAGEFA